MSVLVLGLGNLLMTDDALGSRAVEILVGRYALSPEATVVDGGTLGLDLLPQLEGIERLLIIDALEMGATPGTVFRLEGEEVPRALAGKVSVHQMGVADLLAVAELQGHLPAHLVVWGGAAAVGGDGTGTHSIGCPGFGGGGGGGGRRAGRMGRGGVAGRRLSIQDIGAFQHAARDFGHCAPPPA